MIYLVKGMNWVDSFIEEYTEGRKILKEKREALGNTELDKTDKTQINSMIEEMSVVIEWLKSGKDPYELRGKDKRSAYQKRALLNMDLFPSLDIIPASFNERENSRELTETEKEFIANVLAELSLRERQCYLLHYANRRSFEEIAIELGLRKATVQSYIIRAREKVKDKISEGTK